MSTASRRARAPRTAAIPARASFASAIVWTTMALVVLVPVLWTQRSANPFSVVELAVLGVFVSAGVVLLVLEVGSGTGFRLPPLAVLVSACVLLLALLLATATADRPWLAVVGAEGRNSGLLLYVGCLIALGMAYRTAQAGLARALLFSIAALGCFQVLVCSLQLLGLDWPQLPQIYDTPVVGTLGNPNFVSATLGITSPALAWIAVTGGRPVVRAAGLTLVAGALALALATGSIQGPVAGVAGLAVLAGIGWLPRLQSLRPRLAKRRGPVSLVAGGALALVAVALLSRAVLARGTLDARVEYWRVAWNIFRDSPLLGVGLDRYGAHFGQARTQATVDALSAGGYTNAAHSVPLQMLTSGGLILFAAYIVFIALTGWAVVDGMRRFRDDAGRRWALAAAAGAWSAYQTQSLVSIDQPPLAMLHFVLAGTILGLSWGDRGRLLGAKRPGTGRQVGAAATALTLAAALVYVYTLPLRADMAIRDGNVALRDQDGQEALAAYERAGAIAPWDPRPAFYRGRLLNSAGDSQAAFPLLAEAAQNEPGEAAYALAAAVEALAVGRADLASELAERAVQADPLAPLTKTDAGIVLVNAGEVSRGSELLQEVIEGGGGVARTWAGLGDARRAQGDTQGARQAYQRALELEPGNEAILARLKQLSPAT